MQRKIDDRRLGQIWLERIVWNVLVAASLGFMIAILLCSLQWLDEIDSVPSIEVRGEAERGRIERDQKIETPPRQIARVNAPSG